jgi:hypothetical protein
MARRETDLINFSRNVHTRGCRLFRRLVQPGSLISKISCDYACSEMKAYDFLSLLNRKTEPGRCESRRALVFWRKGEMSEV